MSVRAYEITVLGGTHRATRSPSEWVGALLEARAHGWEPEGTIAGGYLLTNGAYLTIGWPDCVELGRAIEHHDPELAALLQESGEPIALRRVP